MIFRRTVDSACPLKSFFYHSLGWLYLDTNDALCKATHYLRRSAKSWSATLTLLLTIERYLCIAHPLKAGLRSKSVTMAMIAIGFTISFVLPIPLVQYDMVYEIINFCIVDPDHLPFYDRYDLIVIRGFGEGIIGILIFIFTCLIILGLFRARKRSKRMVTSAKNEQSRSAQDSQINNMLLVIVFMFFLARLPYTIAYYLYTFSANRDIYLSPWQVRYVYLSTILSRAFANVNYSTNFIIYVVFVRTFRLNLLGLCSNMIQRRKMRSDSHIAIRTTTLAASISTIKLTKLENLETFHDSSASLNNSINHTLP